MEPIPCTVGVNSPELLRFMGAFILDLLQPLLQELGKVAHSTDEARNALLAPSKLEAQCRMYGGRVPEFL